MVKDVHARIEAITGLQVIDSHGMIVGRVRKAISNDTGDVRSLVLSVDKEQFKTLLDERDLPREFELGHEKIATVGDVVILSDVFSPSALAPPKPPSEDSSNIGKCSRCSAPLIAGAKHCIKCGALLTSASWPQAPAASSANKANRICRTSFNWTGSHCKSNATFLEPYTFIQRPIQPAQRKGKRL